MKMSLDEELVTLPSPFMQLSDCQIKIAFWRPRFSIAGGASTTKEEETVEVKEEKVEVKKEKTGNLGSPLQPNTPVFKMITQPQFWQNVLTYYLQGFLQHGLWQ